MRILANENVPGDVVASLRADHDVMWIRTEAPGIGDDEVVRMAKAENRVLVTFDKDFGELAFVSGLSPECGVILFRIRAANAAELAVKVKTILASRTDWIGQFAVIEEGRVRLRKLPSPRS